MNIQFGTNNFTKVYKSNNSVKGQHQISPESGNQKSQYKVYMKTDEMLYAGGNGTGLSFNIKYADGSTQDNPLVTAKGVDENGSEFEFTFAINDIDPSNASIIEMRALEGHMNVDRGISLTSLPNEAGAMGAADKNNFLEMFETVVNDMKKLGRYDLSMIYMKNQQIYSEFAKQRASIG